MKKYTVCFFLRKSNYGENFSLEKYFYELIKNHYNNKFIFKLKVCPVLSKGILRRFYLMLWAYCNQGDINHICGDVNFLSILLKKKTILTIHDNYSMIRLSGIKKILYYVFWLKLPLYCCKKIVTVSDKTKEEILSFFPEYEKKIIVIDNCIQSIFKKKKKNLITRAKKF
jgi:glycosyltransferase involved in cell wall biosynthesis